MLLECNEVKLIIVNLDSIGSKFDDELGELVDYKSCVFISSDQDRASMLQDQLNDFIHVVPNVWFRIAPMGLLKQILQSNQVQPFEAVYITGGIHEEYNGVGISTMLLLEKLNVELNKNNLPDHYVSSISDLVERLNGVAYGYFGELFADGINGRGYYYKTTLRHDLTPGIEADLYAFGRYFTASDPRSYVHPLSQMILQLKSAHQRQLTASAKLLAHSINFLYQNGLDIDQLTIVPPKPNKQNVLLEVINQAKRLPERSLNSNIVVRELLRVAQNYTPQKEVGSFTNRYLNVKDKFLVNTDEIGGHIAILDDITTSGATALECAKMLYEAGAKEVTIITFGSSQTKSEAEQLKSLSCDNCEDGVYKLRFNSTNHSAFYGCTNFPKCRGSLPYEAGRRRYNGNRAIKPPDDIEDEEF